MAHSRPVQLGNPPDQPLVTASKTRGRNSSPWNRLENNGRIPVLSRPHGGTEAADRASESPVGPPRTQTSPDRLRSTPPGSGQPEAEAPCHQEPSEAKAPDSHWPDTGWQISRATSFTTDSVMPGRAILSADTDQDMIPTLGLTSHTGMRKGSRRATKNRGEAKRVSSLLGRTAIPESA